MHKELFNNVTFGELQSFGSVAAVPIITPIVADAFLYITLSEALEKKLLMIQEVSEGGSVPELKVISSSPLPVLMLSGEEVKGAKQNRILNASILIPSGSELVIPVSCTERGRWRYTAPDFKDSANISSKDVRQAAGESVHASLHENRGFCSDQGRVWEEIEMLHYKSKSHTTSRTRAMDDAFTTKKHDLEEAQRHFRLIPGQTGILFFHAGRVAGLDIVSRPGAYARLHSKLMRSYVIDGLESRKTSHDAEILQRQARNFLDTAVAVKGKVFKSPGLGDDIRIEASALRGSVLVHEKQAIHACCFRVETQESSMASFDKRRRI